MTRAGSPSAPRDEADQVIGRAQEQAAQMLEERELVKLAQQRAGELIDQANDEAVEIRRGADEYAAGVLIRLEGECIKALTSIKRGIDMLDERHRGAAVLPLGTPTRSCTRGAGRRPCPTMTAVNVAGLLHEVPGATRDLRLRDHYVALGPDVELAGPIDGTLRLQRTNRGILVRGALTAPLRRTCARCLEPFVEEVEVPIAEEFLPTLDPTTGEPMVPRRRR